MATAILERPVGLPCQAADLTVRREGIVFCNLAPGRVRLSVHVANDGRVRSTPTLMRIQAAPLGAFVPWKDLTSLVVPPIEPGEGVEVTAEFSAPHPAPLGHFGNVPPARLLTAVAGDDESERRANPGSAGSAFNLLGRLLLGRGAGQDGLDLPPDPLQLLSRPNVHWAGNINVLIGRKPVERHLAQALRIHPGRTNLAVFMVGDRRDEYQFSLHGNDWDAALFDFTDRRSLTDAVGPAQKIRQSEWIAIDRCRVILLVICPPRESEMGSIEVHVRQRSTGRDAVVEFSLDASAAGAGCYAV